MLRDLIQNEVDVFVDEDVGAEVGAGIGIGQIGGSALQSIARQPEMKGDVVSNMFVAAALVEGVALAAVALAFIVGLA